MKENNYEKDKVFMELINELRRIERTKDPKEMLYDFGRLYNEAMNQLVAFHQIDGEDAMDIIDELVFGNRG